ncbi:MAG: acyl-CoA desaturase, partial [Methylophilaceae bacterium]|nr:acyl-CoA desaturase [Methylophilaceae bacterium]
MKLFLKLCLGWFDNSIKEEEYRNKTFKSNEVDWIRAIPYLALHISLISIFFVGYSHIALAVFIFMYALRMFAITGFYH